MIKGVIFDMDGVLVDNRDIHIDAFIMFCKRHNHEMSREALMSMFGRGNDEILPEVLPAELIEQHGVDALGDEKEVIYREIFAEKIAPTTGLVDFLKDLKANGYKCSVGSSGQEANVNFVLERCNIAEYFDKAVNGDMVTRRKPDPEVFTLAAELLGIQAEECVVFEDSFAGIEAAHRAGMKVIAVATTYTKEELSKAQYDYIISDFTEINSQIISKL